MKRLFYCITVLIGFTLFNVSCADKQNKTPTVQLAKDEIYACTMHHDVMSAHEGTCSKCGMKLVKQKMTPQQQKMWTAGTYVKAKP